MSLSLDVYNKKKQKAGQKVTVLDRRRFKGGRSKEENLVEELKKDMEIVGITNTEEVLQDLMRLKEKLKYINFYLLLKVYQYFAGKNFDLSLVFLNFDKDFKEEYAEILINNNYTNDLNTKLNAHKFRQDYIIYLFLLADLDLNNASTEADIEQVIDEDNDLEDKEYFEGAVDFEGIVDDEFQQDY